MASSWKGEIRVAVKEVLKEKLSPALSEHKNTDEEQANDCKAGTSKRTKLFEEFYNEREPNHHKGFKPGKQKKKDPSSASTVTTNVLKKVVDFSRLQRNLFHSGYRKCVCLIGIQASPL